MKRTVFIAHGWNIAQIIKLKGNIERYTLRFSKKLHYLYDILFKP